MKGWTPQAAEQAAKGQKPPQQRPSPPTQGKTPPAGREASTDDVTPSILPASQHYIGPYHIQVAQGTHFPGRTRIVVTGPTAPGLPEALAAAIHLFHQK